MSSSVRLENISHFLIRIAARIESDQSPSAVRLPHIHRATYNTTQLINPMPSRALSLPVLCRELHHQSMPQVGTYPASPVSLATGLICIVPPSLPSPSQRSAPLRFVRASGAGESPTAKPQQEAKTQAQRPVTTCGSPRRHGPPDPAPQPCCLQRSGSPFTAAVPGTPTCPLTARPKRAATTHSAHTTVGISLVLPMGGACCSPNNVVAAVASGRCKERKKKLGAPVTAAV